jgi:hypothetical protein
LTEHKGPGDLCPDVADADPQSFVDSGPSRTSLA